MTDSLVLPDERDVADLGTLVGRAKAVDAGGAVRLRADGTTLAVTVGVVPGTGLLGAGAVVGLRAMALSRPANVDVVVSLEAVADRLARMTRASSTELAIPPVTVQAPWAGQSPPRSGWETRSTVPADTLQEIARAGIEEIVDGAPSGSGAAAVADLRRRVWSRTIATSDEGPGLVAGLAFGAHALGFLAAEPATWHVHGPWQRLSTPAGHVIAR